jgi:hypothetical protein
VHKNIEYGGSGSSKAHDLKLLTLHWLEVALCLSADSPNLNKIVAASSNLHMHVIQLIHKWWIKGIPMFSYNDVRSPFTTYCSCPHDYGSENSLVPIFSKWYISDNIKKERKKNNLRPLVLPYSRLLLVQGGVYYRSCGRWTLLYKTYVIFDIHSLQRGESTSSCLLSRFLLLSTRYERYLMTIGGYFSWFFNY